MSVVVDATVMLRQITMVLAVVAGATAASGQEARQATENEIVAAIEGCWEQEPTFSDMQSRERFGSINQREVCFEPDGVVRTSVFFGYEGLEDEGTFVLEGGQLHLSGSNFDGWIFGRPEVSCDVVMNPGTAMKLMDCVGRGPWPSGEVRAAEELKDMSFAFRPPELEGQ